MKEPKSGEGWALKQSLPGSDVRLHFSALITLTNCSSLALFGVCREFSLVKARHLPCF